jgi:hypothetical protein
MDDIDIPTRHAQCIVDAVHELRTALAQAPEGERLLAVLVARDDFAATKQYVDAAVMAFDRRFPEACP